MAAFSPDVQLPAPAARGSLLPRQFDEPFVVADGLIQSQRVETVYEFAWSRLCGNAGEALARWSSLKRCCQRRQIPLPRHAQ